MNTRLEGGPAFAHLHVDLAPGESIVAESDAMSSMAADLDMTATWNGGFLGALLKRFLGDESLFVNVFHNATNGPRRVTLVQPTPGNMREVTLDGSQTLCLQPGAYVASTPGVTLGVRWAGLTSWIAREGLFKLQVSGVGTVWYGAYGELLERQVDGELIVDTGYLVAYEPQLTLKLQLAGGLLSSILGGEGLVTRVVGRGKVVLQTRSLESLSDWLNPEL